MVPPQYSRTVPMVSPCHSLNIPIPYPAVPVLYQCCPHPFGDAVPFLFCLHSVPMGCPLNIPILSSYCSHTITLLFLWDVLLVSPVSPPAIPILLPWCPLGTPLLSLSCPFSPGSPTLVGTVSRSQLVTFLQSHEHPQAPQGEKVNKVGGTLSHPKHCFSTPKLTCHLPQAGHGRDTWGRLHHRAHHAPVLPMDLLAPGLGGERVLGAPQACVTLRGHSEAGFVPTCPCCPFPRPITSFSC